MGMVTDAGVSHVCHLPLSEIKRAMITEIIDGTHPAGWRQIPTTRDHILGIVGSSMIFEGLATCPRDPEGYCDVRPCDGFIPSRPHAVAELPSILI
jgi:hypothetical protein